jgi:hypothetical protein
MRLFTIGDSLSAGYMSAATARTDLSFSTLIARKLGLRPQTDYFFPTWPYEGVPINLEAIMRTLSARYGSDISGFEWLTVVQTVAGMLDQSEDYYERGDGSPQVPTPDGRAFYHNVAVAGFTVADAWLVTPELCRQQLQAAPPTDDFLQGPDRAMYRVALKVLNPSLDPTFDTFSQLDWLQHHASGEGVDNVLLWLGANNALGTVIALKIKPTPPDLNPPPHQRSFVDRASNGWNLWRPDHFALEFDELMTRVDTIMRQNTSTDWHVCVSNIPMVTIAPVAKGIGDTTLVPGRGVYYKYYTYFPFEEPFAMNTGLYLTMQDAMHIDETIVEFNAHIASSVDQLNAAHDSKRYLLIDMAGALDKLAYKRNAGNPTYEFPSYFDFVYPKVNTKYYYADKSAHLVQGGLFTLDGVHPSAIAHGLLAYEILKQLRDAHIVADAELPWSTIFANDRLYQEPISIMQELYNKDWLGQLVVHAIRLLEQARGVTT